MLTTSGYFDINDGTNQSFIVELGFLGVPSDEDHQKLVINFIYISAFCDSYLWLEKWLCVFQLGGDLT